ncbi:hypothetical protein P4O66_003414 [Electrophorus voltai]|uniref:Uncharacterized protein n=1 Tax=Electrophorus voltai TaxID=2609070 RepID=A0AAD9DK51_9TELE|nr:hypothetical protein P4O66_003414 [Electrophorus voltai]
MVPIWSGHVPPGRGLAYHDNQALQQLDPERPFVVTADASDVGVGTVLLQHSKIPLTPSAGYQPPLYPWNAPTSDQPAVETWCRRSEQVWEIKD